MLALPIPLGEYAESRRKEDHQPCEVLAKTACKCWPEPGLVTANWRALSHPPSALKRRNPDIRDELHASVLAAVSEVSALAGDYNIDKSNALDPLQRS